MPSLKASSKLILKIDSKDDIMNKEIINIKIDKKYLLISFCSIFVSIKWNLLANIFFGLE